MSFSKVPVGNPQRENVYEQLQRAILDGRIAPGEKLVENTYAETFGVSRTPVREAIRMLERDGLVTYIPKRGAFARRRLEREEIDELYTVRSLLQMESCEGIIQNITEDEVRTMKEANALCKKALSELDSELFYENLDLFHKIQTEACRKPLMIRLLGQIETYKPDMAFMNVKDGKRAFTKSSLASYKKTVEEHDVIAAAVEASNLQALQKAVRVHCNRIHREAVSRYTK